MDSPPVTTFSKQSNSPSPSSHKTLIVAQLWVWPQGPSLTYDGIFSGLTLCRTYTGNRPYQPFLAFLPNLWLLHFSHRSLIFPGTWIGQGGWYEWSVYNQVLTITNSEHFNQLGISALTAILYRSFSDQGWTHHKFVGININIKKIVWQYGHFPKYHQWIPSLGPMISTLKGFWAGL